MKKVMKQLATIVLSATVLTFGAQAQQAKSLDELLAHLAEGKIAQSKQNKEREANFIARYCNNAPCKLVTVNNNVSECPTITIYCICVT